MQPEKDLTEMILSEHLSLTDCEEFVIYSNPVIQLGSFWTTLVDVDLHVKKGGEYHTLLNGPVFRKVWDTVIETGTWKHHDWTVKVDLDAVFFPHRLREFIRALDPEDTENIQDRGAFLLNCPLGLHGPLEVLSRDAVRVFAAGRDTCWAAPQEDVYVKECLVKLEIHSIDAFKTLAERDCWRDDWHQDPDWMKCKTDRVSFHPFKTVDKYHTCIANAKLVV